MNLILLEPSDFSGDDIVVLSDRRAKHVRDVLKTVPGQALRVGLLDGPKGEGTVLDINDKQVTLQCRFAAEPPPDSRVSLLLAMPRPKVMKRLWAPIAGFAVDEIILTNAAKVERNYFDTHWLDPDYYEPLLREGLEQAGHTRLPCVRICRRLKPLIEDDLAPLHPHTRLLYAQPSASLSLADVSHNPAQPLLVAIGPEGGWVESELALFYRHGFEPFSLGKHTLRSDVAVIVALGIINVSLQN